MSDEWLNHKPTMSLAFFKDKEPDVIVKKEPAMDASAFKAAASPAKKRKLSEEAEAVTPKKAKVESETKGLQLAEVKKEEEKKPKKGVQQEIPVVTKGEEKPKKQTSKPAKKKEGKRSTAAPMEEEEEGKNEPMEAFLKARDNMTSIMQEVCTKLVKNAAKAADKPAKHGMDLSRLDETTLNYCKPMTVHGLTADEMHAAFLVAIRNVLRPVAGAPGLFPKEVLEILAPHMDALEAGLARICSNGTVMQYMMFNPEGAECMQKILTSLHKNKKKSKKA